MQEAKNEYSAILRQYDETMNQGDYLEKAKLAEDTKTKIVDMSNGMKEANSVLCLLMSELKKQELAKEVRDSYTENKLHIYYLICFLAEAKISNISLQT